MAGFPLGAPDKDWANIVVTVPDDAITRVEDVRAERGFKAWGNRLEIEGAWRLPTIGLDPVPVGVSADGSTIVLVEAGAAAAKDKTSRFAIVARTLDAKPRIVELEGRLRIRRPVARRLPAVRRRAPAGSAGGPLPGPDRRDGDRHPAPRGRRRQDRRQRDDGRLAGRPGASIRRPGAHPLPRRGAPVHPCPQQHRFVGDLPRPAGDRRRRRGRRARLGPGRQARRRPARDQRDARAGGRGRPVRLRGQALGPVRAVRRSRHRARQVRPPAHGAGRATGRGRIRWVRVLRGRARWDRPDRSEDPRRHVAPPRGLRRGVDGRDTRRHDHLCADWPPAAGS